MALKGSFESTPEYQVGGVVFQDWRVVGVAPGAILSSAGHNPAPLPLCLKVLITQFQLIIWVTAQAWFFLPFFFFFSTGPNELLIKRYPEDKKLPVSRAA